MISVEVMKKIKSYSTVGAGAVGRRRRRALRLVSLIGAPVALPAAILALVFISTGHADSIERQLPASGGFAAKMQYCEDCHGPSGQGYRGFFPIPRLAGQQTEYFENQLRAFVERRRPNNIMANVAHVLSPSMITALAKHFRSLNPSPLGGAPRHLVATGRKIFEDGVPDANVAACAACHGPDATGHGQIPRLAGQLYPYLVKALSNWGKERGQLPGHPDTSFIMAPVAHSLKRPEIEAVAAYLSNVK